MATLLSHLQPQQPPSSIYSNPTHNHTHFQLQNQHQAQSFANFCKDCGVMFESSTSLEVHLSYHKENLLSRWAQDSLDKSSGSSSSGSGSLIINPSSPSPIKRERSDNSSVESNASSSSANHYFHLNHPSLMDSHPPNSQPPPSQYMSPLYNNNTGDQHQHMQHSPSPTTPTFRPHQPFLVLPPHHSQPPVDSYEHFHASFQQNGGGGGGLPMFSPNPNGNANNGDHHSQQGQQGGQGQRDSSAEILDLDSHKVHIYQHQQQQQQQQQQGFFHRPYLPHLLPPPPPHPLPHQPNGWGSGGSGGEPHFAARFSPAGYEPQLSNNNFYQTLPVVTSASVPPPNGSGSNGMGSVSYEIVKIENPNYSPGPEGQSQNFQQQQNGNVAPFGHQSPYIGGPPRVKPEHVSPPGAVVKAQRSPILEGPVAVGNKTNGNGSPAVKTKGWKGGECKRPKTYNCPACNKWFTSSGHLKRHYGTTLHKNSIKQLGDSAEELFKNQPKRKGAKANNGGEGKTPKQPKGQKNRRDPLTSPPASLPPLPQHLNQMDIGGDDEHNHSPKIKVEPHSQGLLMYGAPQEGPVNGNGEGVLIKHHQLPMFGNMIQPPRSSPNNFPYYGPPATHVPPPHPHSHLPPFNHNGGIYPSPLDFVPLQPHPSQPPTTTYNTNNGNNGVSYQDQERQERQGPLPPFSSVGLSHYDGGLDPNNFQNQNRVTPPYHHPSAMQQQHNNSTPSPHNHLNLNNSGGQGHEMGQHENSPYDSMDKRGINNNRDTSPYEGMIRGVNVGGGGGGSDSGGSEGGSSMDGSGEDGGRGRSSSGERRPGGKQPSSESEAVKEVHKCPDCNKTFMRSCYFKQHFKQLHSNSHSGGQTFRCEQCGKRFPAQPALSDHLAKHGSDKPYKCTQCDKSFNHKTDLNRHRHLHTGDRPFVCEQCGKGFIRKDHMSKHSETHRKKQQQLSNSNNSSPSNS